MAPQTKSTGHSLPEKNTGHPDTFAHLIAKSDKRVSDLRRFAFVPGEKAFQRERVDVVVRKRQTDSFLLTKVNEVDPNIVSSDALAYRSRLLVPDSLSKSVVGHFPRNASDVVFAQHATNLLLQDSDAVGTTFRGAALQGMGCSQNEHFALHVISITPPLARPCPPPPADGCCSSQGRIIPAHHLAGLPEPATRERSRRDSNAAGGVDPERLCEGSRAWDPRFEPKSRRFD